MEEEIDMTIGAAGAGALDELEPQDFEPEDFVPGSDSDEGDDSDRSQFSDDESGVARAHPMRSFGRRSLAAHVDPAVAALPKPKLTVRNLQKG